jgi:hypothetical protein
MEPGHILSYNLTSVLQNIHNFSSFSQTISNDGNSNISWRNTPISFVWNDHEDLTYVKRKNCQISAPYHSRYLMKRWPTLGLLQCFAFLSMVQFSSFRFSFHISGAPYECLKSVRTTLELCHSCRLQRHILQTEASCRISISNTASSSQARVTVSSGSST